MVHACLAAASFEISQANSIHCGVSRWVKLMHPLLQASLKALVALPECQGYRGIPDLHARIETMTAEGNTVTARVTVIGTHRGSLFSAPATGRFFQVNGFDTVEIEEGKIVRRIQQADLAGQMGQLFGPWLKGLGVALGAGVVGLGVALWRK